MPAIILANTRYSRIVAQRGDFHAHLYFDATTAEAARALRARIGNQFEVELGNWNERPVGPHPTWSAEIIFATAEFGSLVPWLALHRNGLSVLVHPNTGDDLADHRDHAMWLGVPVALRLDVLGPDN